MASMVAMEAKVVEVVMATTVAAVQAISIHYRLVVLSSTSFNGFFIQRILAGNSQNRILAQELRNSLDDLIQPLKKVKYIIEPV